MYGLMCLTSYRWGRHFLLAHFLMFFSTIDSFTKFSVLMGILYFHVKFHRLPVYQLKCMWNFAVSYHLIGFAHILVNSGFLKVNFPWIILRENAIHSVRNIKRKIYFILWKKEKDFVLGLPLLLLSGDCC